jgi:hypothetical protein
MSFEIGILVFNTFYYQHFPPSLCSFFLEHLLDLRAPKKIVHLVLILLNQALVVYHDLLILRNATQSYYYYHNILFVRFDVLVMIIIARRSLQINIEIITHVDEVVSDYFELYYTSCTIIYIA